MMQHQLPIRVAYHETDGQRRVHHSNYLNYFERGRVEMLRSIGCDYKAIEEQGLLLVVTEMNVRYHWPADFDDLLTLTTTVTQVRRVRMRHHYELFLQDRLLVDADSVIACLTREGKPARLPDFS